jgi:acyl-CoA reductase-like NAD-dependent aldehyde dehydrogenase
MSDPTPLQAQAHKLLDELRAGQQAWASLPVQERARRLNEAGKAMLAGAPELSKLLSEETGRPEAESWSLETVGIADLFSYWCKHGPALLQPRPGKIPALDMPGKKARVERRPRGVIAVISPWNYPASLPMRSLVPALLAGNAVALKPSEVTPRSGKWLIERLRAHLGPVVGLLEGAAEAGSALIEARPDMVIFTGSTRTGRKVAVACAERGIACELELGGKDCAVVLDDADIQRAAAGIAWGILHNGGQDCASVERLAVHARVAELFERALVKHMEQAAPYVSDLITEAQRHIVTRQLEEARTLGASFPTGGATGAGKIPPTLATHLPRHAALWREESFGPVAAMVVCANDEELIAAANDTTYGLGTSIWTKDLKRGERLAAKARSGMVWINNHAFTGAVPDLPWVGTGDSGSGITNSPEALLHMTTPHLIAVDTSTAPEPWWYPYTDNMLSLMKAAVARQRYGGVGATLGALSALRARNKDF